MGDVAISMKGVSKRYEVFGSQRGRLLHAIWPGFHGGMREVWALRDVGLEVRRGESLAVIGRNGGGKSTLLQVLTGVLAPTQGEVQVEGRVCALLELGSGFNPEYTGRDNVVLNGLLLGLARDEIVRRFDEIAAFAEIGDAMDRPVKTYSSGMVMRLAFAVQALADPDILVIDEALSVGDFFFQQKCLSHIRALSERGVTVILVSHDMGTVRDMCRRAVYLRQGRVEFDGETREAVRRYLSERGTRASAEGKAAAGAQAAHAGELEAILRDAIWSAPEGPAAVEPGRLVAVAVYDEQGQPATSFRLGSVMHVKVAYRPAASVPTHVTALIRNKYDQVVTSLGSSRLGLVPPTGERDPAPSIFEIRIQLRLEAGNYSLAVNLSHLLGPNHGENLDTSGPLGPIAVTWDYERDAAPFLGMFGLESAGEFKQVRDAAAEAGRDWSESP